MPIVRASNRDGNQQCKKDVKEGRKKKQAGRSNRESDPGAVKC